MRTTLDLADPVLGELKDLREKEGGSLGALASRLLADAMSARRSVPPAATKLNWSTQAMSALVDLGDKEALYRTLDKR